MDFIIDKFKTINFNKKNLITGFNLEMMSLFLTYLSNDKKDILVVTSTLSEANKLYQTLSNYYQDTYLFPIDDFITIDLFATSPELKTTRIDTLNTIVYNKRPKIVVTNLMGYLKTLPNVELWENSRINLKKKEAIKRDDLINRFQKIGYEKESLVTKTGEFAVRGYILDIFPVGEDEPIRIEFFGDEIEEIRYFNSDNQRSIKEVLEVNINPFKESIIEEENVKYNFSIRDYLKSAVLIFNESYEIEITNKKIEKDMVELNENNQQGHIHMLKKFNEEPFISFSSSLYDVDKYDNVINFELKKPPLFNSKLEEIKSYLVSFNNKKTIIIALKNVNQAKKFNEKIDNMGYILNNNAELKQNKINVIIQQINEGFIYDNYIVLTPHELFNQKENKYKVLNDYKYGVKVRSISALNIGDFVVHQLYGIGIYNGITTLNKGDIKKDYLQIIYRDDDKLYIPAEKINLITKYSSKEGASPKINRLGGVEWLKTKNNVRKKLENIAGRLLKIYAERQAKKGFSFKSDNEEQLIFEEEFIYTPTTDQVRATMEIKEDMEKNIPMDRLLCGDVGFGKTEVAFRAAFKAIYNSKQVLYLCPTTILSIQHYENAKERFKNYPINIELLNRFTSVKKTKEILEGLENGKIDFVIGTHRLLSNDVKPHDLGLLIIDEEQRFGVKHKEKIKEYKTNIDILTLSATPIPRTLQMSIVGIRNLSLLETPPINRFPIQTYVLPEDKKVISEAIKKELSRDGQVFILFNNIKDMEDKMSEIKLLIPDARITYIHGQMGKNDIEDRMVSFQEREYDILLTTTIIETGIDIPTVNTLIVYDADYFGLSQLYQIRGRVGRSGKIAYAYLMYNNQKILSDIAKKRLNAIKEFTELGSGYQLALRDLSIRGAGDILGSEQAGFIDAIGVDLYLKLLNEEVNKIKGIEIEEEEKEERPLIEVETHIPSNFASEEEIKIEVHQKINEIDSLQSLEVIRKELLDRFGVLPDEMLIYMYQELFESLAKKLKVFEVRQTKKDVMVMLNPDISIKIDGEKLFFRLNEISPNFKVEYKNEKIRIILDIKRLEKHFVYYLVEIMMEILSGKLYKKH